MVINRHHRSQIGGDRHRRRWPRISREHQRRHRYRRRHGAGLPPWCAPLRDMEFVQYPAPGLLLPRLVEAEGGFLLNKDGYRYLQDYGLGPAEPTPRNKAMELVRAHRLNQAFWLTNSKKIAPSRGPAWSVVHLDLRHMGEKKLRERLPQIYEWPTSPRCGPRQDADSGAPRGAHDGRHLGHGHCAAPLKRGRSLPVNSSVESMAPTVWGPIHWLNRVFGKVAGEGAATYARSVAAVPSAKLGSQAKAAQQRALALVQKNDGKERISKLRREMAETMERGCGIFRMADEMQRTVDHLAELRERYQQVKLDDHSSVFNTEWLLAIELGYQLEVAQAMAVSALNRRESRGAHQRLDEFKTRDDVNYLKHTLATYAGADAPTISYADVQITHSQPAERAYGAAGEKADAAAKARRAAGSQDMSGQSRVIRIEVLRYRPEQEQAPVVEAFDVPFTEDMSVLRACNTSRTSWTVRCPIAGPAAWPSAAAAA